MRDQVRRSLVAVTAAAAVTALAVATTTVRTVAQAPAAGRGQAPAGRGQAAAAPRPTGTIPRTSWDKKPDLNGIWQVMSTANDNLEDHDGGPSSVIVTGAIGAHPAGLSVVEGGAIPYKPEALAKRDENRRRAMPGKTGRDVNADPELNCFLPGVPRATYLPYPFQIFQSPGRMWFSYEYSYARREIFMDKFREAPIDSWMGWSNGKWEGDTLVVDVTGFNDTSWFDRSGNYHSDSLHVVERYTMLDATHINYEATIEDPMTFTRPWKINVILYKHIEPNAQLLEFKCAEYVEEFFWGEYRKTTAPPAK
jgi:hypothetical protein